jgi:hypothetical protein
MMNNPTKFFIIALTALLVSVSAVAQQNLPSAEEALKLSLKYAASITYESDKANAYRDIVSALAKLGRFDAALAVAKSISDEFRKVEAYRDIVFESTKAGRFEAALVATKFITDESDKARAFSSVYLEIFKAKTSKPKQ